MIFNVLLKNMFVDIRSVKTPKQSGRGWVSKRPLANGGLASESANYPQIGRVGRRRRVEARGRKPTCKIQNSKFGHGERPNFEF